tara:strand:- start:301 stop:1026 length:726 start_codon:yes stop_codon:yes gene_type:complete
MNWYGGKPAGWRFNHDDFCQVAFTRSTGLKSCCFKYKDYPSKIQALAEAEKWQKETSDKHGLTKNMYRIVNWEGEKPYLEVLLQQNLTMLCDLKHLHLVEERIWTANKAKNKYTYYVKSRESKKRNQTYGQFHRLAFPQYKECDHINRNGLDNRSVNVREGRGRVNANNKRIPKNNTSGVKGVFHEGGKKPRWRAQWNDVNGKKCSKSFGVGKWGNDESYEMVCNWRAQEMNKVNTKIFTK